MQSQELSSDSNGLAFGTFVAILASMSLFKTNLTRATLSSLAAATFAMSACAQEEPPELPQVSSMSANLEAPNSAPAPAKNADPAVLGDYQNFANAYVRVRIVQTAAVAAVVLPAAVMGIALTQEPTKEGDTWHWSVTALGSTADLFVNVGLVDGWDVEMYITNNEVTDFLWIEGDFAVDLSSGTWLSHSAELPAASNEVLEIGWTHISETENSLTYTNVNSDHEGFEDVMSFSIGGTTATLVFDDASEPDQVANITWDLVSKAGSIEVPLFNNGEVACWDDVFENSDCQ